MKGNVCRTKIVGCVQIEVRSSDASTRRCSVLISLVIRFFFGEVSAALKLSVRSIVCSLYIDA